MELALIISLVVLALGAVAGVVVISLFHSKKLIEAYDRLHRVEQKSVAERDTLMKANKDLADYTTKLATYCQTTMQQERQQVVGTILNVKAELIEKLGPKKSGTLSAGKQ